MCKGNPVIVDKGLPQTISFTPCCGNMQYNQPHTMYASIHVAPLETEREIGDQRLLYFISLFFFCTGWANLVLLTSENLTCRWNKATSISCDTPWFPIWVALLLNELRSFSDDDVASLLLSLIFTHSQSQKLTHNYGAGNKHSYCWVFCTPKISE